jgi:hypothetical protein
VTKKLDQVAPGKYKLHDPVVKAKKDKHKGKKWKTLKADDQIEYLAALLGIKPDTVL